MSAIGCRGEGIVRMFMLVGLIGCEIQDADVDTGDGDVRPDIQGVYSVSPPTEVVGCETMDVDTDWLVAGLEIIGPADALVFRFAGGEELTGDIDTAFTFTAAGTVDIGPLEWDVSLEGLAFIGDETWQLDGDLDATITDSTAGTPACTLTGRLEAEQDPP